MIESWKSVSRTFDYSKYLWGR